MEQERHLPLVGPAGAALGLCPDDGFGLGHGVGGVKWDLWKLRTSVKVRHREGSLGSGAVGTAMNAELIGART